MITCVFVCWFRLPVCGSVGDPKWGWGDPRPRPHVHVCWLITHTSVCRASLLLTQGLRDLPAHQQCNFEISLSSSSSLTVHSVWCSFKNFSSTSEKVLARIFEPDYVWIVFGSVNQHFSLELSWPSFECFDQVWVRLLHLKPNVKSWTDLCIFITFCRQNSKFYLDKVDHSGFIVVVYYLLKVVVVKSVRHSSSGGSPNTLLSVCQSLSQRNTVKTLQITFLCKATLIFKL